MTKTRRIFDIAKELNISHIEIINFLDTKGIKTTIMSSISNEIYAEILDQFYHEKSQVDRLRKEKARLNVIHHNQELNNPLVDLDEKSETNSENLEKTIKTPIVEDKKEEIKTETDASKKEENKKEKITIEPISKKKKEASNKDISPEVKIEKSEEKKERKLKKIDRSNPLQILILQFLNYQRNLLKKERIKKKK